MKGLGGGNCRLRTGLTRGWTVCQLQWSLLPSYSLPRSPNSSPLPGGPPLPPSTGGGREEMGVPERHPLAYVWGLYLSWCLLPWPWEGPWWQAAAALGCLGESWGSWVCAPGRLSPSNSLELSGGAGSAGPKGWLSQGVIGGFTDSGCAQETVDGFAGSGRAQRGVCRLAGSGRPVAHPAAARASRWRPGRPQTRARGSPSSSSAIPPFLLVTAWAQAHINFLGIFKTAAASRGLLVPRGTPRAPLGGSAGAERARPGAEEDLDTQDLGTGPQRFFSLRGAEPISHPGTPVLSPLKPQFKPLSR